MKKVSKVSTPFCCIECIQQKSS